MNQSLGTIEIGGKDEIVMKLLHYFTTEKGYNPIVLHGAQNEIWLENLSEEYRIIRIVSNYIHNDEQFDFDVYRTKQIMKRIKRKTFSFGMNAISFYLDLGDNVHLEEHKSQNLLCYSVQSMEDIENNPTILKIFPDLMKETDFKEKGLELFLKITDDINKKSEEDAKKAERVFEKKTPYITYGLIGINVVVFLLMYVLGNGSEDSETLLKFGANFTPLIVNGEYYRLLTSAFLHIGAIHLLMNMWALYVLGIELESYYGKWKFLCIYLGSAIFGNLMSMLFLKDTISAGASGAIFGLFGAILYFGYHYRVFLGNVIRSQIIPVILINFMIGLLLPGIDNAAHIGGLLGGVLISAAVGVPFRSTKSDQINGFIMTMISLVFLIYMGFFA